jgi:hypothetical protein
VLPVRLGREAWGGDMSNLCEGLRMSRTNPYPPRQLWEWGWRRRESFHFGRAVFDIAPHASTWSLPDTRAFVNLTLPGCPGPGNRGGTNLAILKHDLPLPIVSPACCLTFVYFQICRQIDDVAPQYSYSAMLRQAPSHSRETERTGARTGTGNTCLASLIPTTQQMWAL